MDRNQPAGQDQAGGGPSLSARRAWIEMRGQWKERRGNEVALRKESVDRNFEKYVETGLQRVALRKESVDRNYVASTSASPACVALRKESVDRNSVVRTAL